MTAIEKILKSYPNSTNHRINECFRPDEGWIRMFGINLVPITETTIEKLKIQKVTHINILLTDEFGADRYPDFTINELLNVHSN